MNDILTSILFYILDKMQALEHFVKEEVYRHVKDYYKEQSGALPVQGP